MSFNTYYADELSFLREMGQAFARTYPRLAPFLAEPGSDPDVERLLEGFAFLSGRLRQKLDDELPEVTHELMGLLWPHYLRPVPAMSLLRFESIPDRVTTSQHIPRGTEVDAEPLEGTRCRFRTCYDVTLHPLTLQALSVRQVGPTAQLTLRFACHPRTTLAAMPMDTLRLYFHGDLFVSQALYVWFCHYLESISVRTAADLPAASAPPPKVRPVGFTEEESLLPYPPNAFVGYRLLQEYFTLPRKFLFVDVTGLAPHLARLERADGFELACTFSRPLETSVHLTEDHIALHCTPIVNLFSQPADPIRLDHRQVEYLVRPAEYAPEHCEINTIDHVVGWVQGQGTPHVYQPFLSFDRAVIDDDRQAIYYRTRLKPAVLGTGTDRYIAFVTPADTRAVPEPETIALRLTCSNRHLPEQLRIGDIALHTSTSPAFARFHNITPVTPSVLPPLDGGLPWQLIANMALHYSSLTSLPTLRRLLSTYNFQQRYDLHSAREHALRMEGLVAIRTTAIERLLKGSPIRGVQIDLEVHGSKFTSEGDLYLFTAILHEFFALYATINSFHTFIVHNVERGDTYPWPAKIGQQPLL